jgi:hypothetical protein
MRPSSSAASTYIRQRQDNSRHDEPLARNSANAGRLEAAVQKPAIEATAKSEAIENGKQHSRAACHKKESRRKNQHEDTYTPFEESIAIEGHFRFNPPNPILRPPAKGR